MDIYEGFRRDVYGLNSDLEITLPHLKVWEEPEHKYAHTRNLRDDFSEWVQLQGLTLSIWHDEKKTFCMFAEGTDRTKLCLFKLTWG